MEASLTLPPHRFRDAAALGLRPIPVRARDKRAALDWKDYQTNSPAEEDLVRWDESNFNVAVVTGIPGGVVVLNVDNDQAQKFVDEELDLPATATVITGRGRHYYFRAPLHEVRNAVGLADLKLDLRGLGGYVVAPGSIHPDGTAYQWENSPAEVGFASCPQQVLALLETKKSSQRRAVATSAPTSNGSIGHDLEESCPARDQVGQALTHARNLVFSVPAPTIAAVVEKLSIWWGESIWRDTYEMSLNRHVIGDLRRLELEAAGVDHTEASGRSPNEVAELADKWRAALADYREELELFVEGPSTRWGGREATDIIGAMDYAAGALLELPAPKFGGVVRKLELLWEDDRFETI